MKNKQKQAQKLEQELAEVTKQRNEAKAILETVCFHLRQNDHVTPPIGATC
jgi:hypothetical protein